MMKNSSDKSVFMRHGDLKSQVSIDIKAIRDLYNILGMLSPDEHEEMLYAVNEDTLGQICKFHNIAKKDVMQKMQVAQSPMKPGKKASVSLQKVENIQPTNADSKTTQMQ